jgi:glycosyltransferase 2 family protein
MDYKKYLKLLLSIIVVALFVAFFYKEFRENWESVRTFHLQINWGYIVLGIFMMVANYLCATLSWHIGINYFDNQKKLKFTQSIALVNISQLAKYIPGKLWSYAVQIYWLASKGVPKTTVLYLNIMTTLLTILVSMIMGCLFLMMIPDWHYYKTEMMIFITILLILNLIILNNNFLKLLIGMFSKMTEQEISFNQLSPCRIISMEFFYMIGALFWIFAGCFIALGLGFNLDGMRALFIAAAMLLGDVIGFIILIAPGGLGVREGAIFLILKGTGIIQFALIFPVVVRLLNIITDLIMGMVSVLIMSSSKYFPRNNK